MKKFLLTFVLLAGIVFGLFAQKLTYQAVIRDNNQQLVVNTAVTATVTIDFTGDQADYDTTITDVSTNIHGLLSFEFGGDALNGRNWEGATIAVKVVNSTTPSTVYVNGDARPVSAVPYALSVNGQSIQNYLTEHNYVDLDKLKDTLNAYPTTAVMDGRHYLTSDSAVITTMQGNISTNTTNIDNLIRHTAKNALRDSVASQIHDSIADLTVASHNHSNKELLDTYTQTEDNLAEAVAKKHAHSNADILNNTTATYTDADSAKLRGIQDSAEVNVQADWSQNTTTADDYIKNKPSIKDTVNTILDTKGYLTSDSAVITAMQSDIAALQAASLDCDDVKNCIKDTLSKYTPTTDLCNVLSTCQFSEQSLADLLQGLSDQIAAQNRVVDSLGHLVDSLSDLAHGEVADGQPCPGAATVSDGTYTYHTVKIGSQCWTKENLKTQSSMGTTRFPGNDENNVATYGLLYDRIALVQGESGSTIRGICPVGWHVPNDDEWDELANYLSTRPDEIYQCGFDASNTANALSAPTGWSNRNDDGCCAGNRSTTRNRTGFSALPAGSYYNGYNLFGSCAYFWSATTNNASVRYRNLAYDYSTIRPFSLNSANCCFSVRCLRDAGIGGGTPSAPATMNCDQVMNCLGDTLGRLNARITSQGETIAAQGTEIETLSGTVTAQGQAITVQGETITAQGNTIDSLSHIVDSLSNLPHGGGDTPTEVADGQPCPGAAKVQDADGNEYNTVKIGNQCWMAQNLRTTTRQYGNVWTNSDVDSAIYGRYYDWQAAMQIDVANNQTYSGSDVKHQGICPTGWHVPSDAEWDTLTHYVFNSTSPDYKCGSSCGSWSAQSNVSCIAKALSSTTGWNSNTSEGCNAGNTGDKANATGFAAVPAGGCLNGNSSNFGDHASFWSATQNGDNTAWSRTLHGSDSLVHRGRGGKGLGFSVRCLRDAGIGGAPGSNETAGTTPSTPATMSCEQVMECMGDTLGRLNARITSQGETITAQGETIDSLAHIVDSLSNLTPVTPVTPTDTFDCGTDKVKDAQNNEYNTVQIGDQCWTKENLRTNVGTGDYGYPTGVSGTADTVTYGRLYSWAAVMNGASASSDVPSGVPGICPEGWHVPSDGEWGNLINYVKSKAEYRCGDGYDNIANALSSEMGWTNSGTSGCNAGDSNEKRNLTGFSAVPAGEYSGSSCIKFGSNAYFWSTTKSSSAGYYKYLENTSSSMNAGFEFSEDMGLSVRCLRN